MKIGNIYLVEDGSVTARLCKVNPNEARMLLERNKNNRPISKGHVTRFVQEIRSGQWVPISNGIGFDIKGVLVDGQHRLWACVEADTPIWLLVVTGLPEAAMIKSDRGTGKSLPFLLAQSGFCGDRRAVQVARYLARRDSGSKVVSDSTVMEYIELYRDSLLVVSIATKDHSKLCAVGFCAAITEAHTIYRERAIDFMKKVRSEIGHTDSTCPALRLRSVMLERLGGFSSMYQDELYQRTCYAFNAYIQSRKIPRVLLATKIVKPEE